MIAYIESYWMQMDLTVWNMFKVKDRTNNKAEGYNYALGSKKVISRHPNPYQGIYEILKDTFYEQK